MKILFKALLLALVIPFQYAVAAGHQTIEDALAKVRIGAEDVYSELLDLAMVSQAAKEMLLRDERGTAEFHANMYYLWELAYWAAKDCSWNIQRCRRRFPHLCDRAGLVGVLRDKQRHGFTVTTFGGAGLVLGKQTDGRFAFDSPFTMERAEHEYSYIVDRDVRGDALLARWEPRVIRGDSFRRVITEYLYVSDSKLALLKRVTEEYPVDTERD